MRAARGPGPFAESIPDLLAIHARSCPRAPAIAAPGRRALSFRQLLGAVERIAEGLNALGFGRGARIALGLPAGTDLAVATLGVSAGAVAVPLDPRLTSAELGASFGALDVEAVIVREGLDSPARLAARAGGLPVVELSPRLNDPAGLFSLHGRARRTPAATGHSTPDDVAFVLQTSGTTGAPKAVLLRHRQLCAAARNVVNTLVLTSEDRCLNVMPLFHVHGLVGALLASLTAGSRVTCVPGFSALRFFAWIEGERPTWYTAVPAMHQAIVRLAARSGGRAPARLGLRLVRSSSAPLLPRVMAELEGLFGAPVIEAYGMTEAAHQITSNPLPPAPRKPGSVGLPAGVEVAVLDRAGRRIDPGWLGEITIRGDTVSRDTEDGPGRSPGEWLRTGDAGFFDPDGYLHITGRLSEAINRGGEKISPQEVDVALLDHPAVADAVAVPLPDQELGEEVGALVVLRRGARTTVEEIRAFVAERLAPFKVPRRLELVAAIPRQVTGKVARRRLGESLGSHSTTRTWVPGAPSAAAPSSGGGGALPARLLAFVTRQVEERRGWHGPPPTEETSLIRSGLFDSLALVELAEWIGREAGEALGAGEARLLAECDTVRDVLKFLEARRSTAPKRTRPGWCPVGSTRAFPEYRFEPYRPEWRDGLLALQQHHWGPDAGLNAAIFEWKYGKNPYASRPLVYLALRDDQVVGMRGFCGGLWEIGRRPRVFRALSGGDLVVSPAHRDRGIVHGIMTYAHVDLARRGFEVLFNFSAGRATYLASLATGWRTTAVLDVVQRRDARDQGTPRDDVFAELDRAAAHAGSAPISIDRAPRPAAMLAILDRIRRDGRLRQVRDERYLAWRYGNPMSRYRFLFWDERRAQGYLVLQTPVRPPPRREARVNVIEWAATGARARDGLLRFAVGWGAFPEVRVWSASVADRTRRLLDELGFRPLVDSGRAPPHPATVLVRLLEAKASRRNPWLLAGRPLLDLATWHLRMAYSDGL